MKSKEILKAKKAFIQIVKKYKIKKNIFIGFSGGQDSLALTLIGKDIIKDIGVIIINHNILKNANSVEKQIRNLAKKIGIKKIFIENIKVSKTNVEKSARDERYKAFEKVIKRESINYLLLAHTKNDQAETVLLNLIRGSGINALKGMPEKREKYIRPFLFLFIIETLKICEYYGYEHWKDPSNSLSKNAPLRVKLREKIIPEIEKVSGRNIIDNLSRTATEMGYIYKMLNEMADKKKTFQISKLINLPIVIRHLVIRNYLIENGVNPSKLLKKHLSEIDKLIIGYKGQRQIQIPNNIQVTRLDNGKIKIEKSNGIKRHK